MLARLRQSDIGVGGTVRDREKGDNEKLYEHETALVRENAQEPRDSAVHTLRPSTIVHVSPVLVAACRPGVCLCGGGL